MEEGLLGTTGITPVVNKINLNKPENFFDSLGTHFIFNPWRDTHGKFYAHLYILNFASVKTAGSEKYKMAISPPSLVQQN